MQQIVFQIFFVFTIILLTVNVLNAALTVADPKTRRAILDECVNSVNMEPYRFLRSIRDHLGYPCVCTNGAWECCVFIHAESNPVFSKEVCFNSTVIPDKPEVKVDMLFDRRKVLTYGLTGPVLQCIEYKANKDLKFCMDFKQVKFQPDKIEFCINLHIYNHERFTLIFFRCLHIPRH